MKNVFAPLLAILLFFTAALPVLAATYVVQSGDTLYSIATRHGMTVNALKAANGLTSDVIWVGQTLQVGSSSPQPSTGTYHTVVRGDTLYSLARRYGTTVDAIMRANWLASPNIYVGQRLLISSLPVPPTGSTTYTVVRGDTLYSIARRYGTTVDAIKAVNSLSSNYIYVGQPLLLPSAQTPIAPTAPILTVTPIGSATPTGTPTPTAVTTFTPSPSSTVPPTQTPVTIVPPTNTSIPPTMTPLPTNTPLATATSVSPTSTSTPTAIPTTEDTLQSQGLGMKFANWKAIHGEPTSDEGGGVYVFVEPGGVYTIIEYFDRLAHVRRLWPEGSFPDFEVAKVVAQTLMPSDAIFQSFYTLSAGRYVEVYFSQQLATAYPNGPYDEIIGEFIVVYHRLDDGTVSGILLATGNNP